MDDESRLYTGVEDGTILLMIDPAEGGCEMEADFFGIAPETPHDGSFSLSSPLGERVVGYNFD